MTEWTFWQCYAEVTSIPDDIVARLESQTPYGLDDCTVLLDAADEIKRLRQEIALLKMVRYSEELGLYDKDV